ncbi:MAG: retron system putative HNH endonuclease [Alphaproteobacteria bacterium]
MKRIRGLAASPGGLAGYLADGTADHGWEDFGSWQGGDAKRQLAAELADVQHGLCCYCECRLIEDDRQVEHFVPRSDPAQGDALALAFTNHLACCKGGTNRNFAADVRNPDRGRYLPPVAANLSCGQAKGDAGGVLDPRQLLALPSVVKVDESGAINADAAACAASGVNVDDVKKSLKRLGLRCERLVLQRAAVWQALKPILDDVATLPENAKALLLPDGDGELAPFFTTIRSFFEDYADTVLAPAPQDWI